MFKHFALLSILLMPALWADGGAVLVQKQAGPFRITIFGPSADLRAGKTDISIMVQKSSDKSPVLDAKVNVRLRRTGPEGISEVYAPATHARATNKLLYAANVTIPSAGKWALSATVDAGQSNAEVASDLNVLEPEPAVEAYWPYFVTPLALVVLFLLNRRLKRNRRLRYPQVRSSRHSGRSSQ